MRRRRRLTAIATVLLGVPAVATTALLTPTAPAAPDVAAKSVDEPETVIVRQRVKVPRRREQPPEARVTEFRVSCPSTEYTAVAGQVHRSGFANEGAGPPPESIVVVESVAGVSDGGFPEGRLVFGDGWTFELSNYGARTTEVELVVTCVKGAPRPPRYLYVGRPILVLPRTQRNVDVDAPRFSQPLGVGFRVRSTNGAGPPVRAGRVELVGVRVTGTAVRATFRNTGSAQARVEVGALVLPVREGATDLARTRLVTATAVVPARASRTVARACPAGTRPLNGVWDATHASIAASATPTARGFSYRATNRSAAPRRIRFGGVCLGVEPVRFPALGPVVARTSGVATVYDVAVGPELGQSVSVEWAKQGSECGQFGANAGSPTQATWVHPHPPCPAEQVHPATITVFVTSETWVCVASYGSGSAAGTGPPPPACERP